MAPTTLTIAGSIGIIGVAVFTAKGTIKAVELIKEKEMVTNQVLTIKEKVKIALPVYIPTILFSAGTISCFFGANTLNRKNYISLLGAYTFLNDKFASYKYKTLELFGEDADQQIIDSIVWSSYPQEDTDEFKDYFYDSFSGRFFRSTKNDMFKAQYELNKLMITGELCSLNDYYKLVGLAPIPGHDDIGWTQYMMEEMYWHSWIEFATRDIELDDGETCTIVSFPHEPICNYQMYPDYI